MARLTMGMLVVALLLASSRVSRAEVPYGCRGVIDMTFVMDQSESIRENDPLDKPDHNWELFKGFVRALVRGLPVGLDTRVAMVKYSSSAEVMWPLDKYSRVDEIEQAVDKMELAGGNTNTAEALERTRKEVYDMAKGDRPDARNVVVLMTDGLSTIRRGDVIGEALMTRDAGIEIYTVAIGRYIDEEELRGIVDDFGKHIVRVQDFTRLASIQDLLLHRVCGLPDPDPPSDKPSNCDRIMDLALIVDNSGSIRDKNKDEDNYQRLKDFLANLVDQLDIGEDRTRVGAVRFSDIAELEFYLNTYYDKEVLKNKIRKMEFRGSHTNTSGGIRLTVQKIYNESNGDRPAVSDVAIIVTDGESTREQNRTLAEATRAKFRGIQLYVVGVTDEINEEELKEIASDPDEEHFFESTDIKYLNSIIFNLIKNVCEGKK